MGVILLVREAARSVSDNEYLSSLPSCPPQVGLLGGAFEASLLLGDTASPQPLAWRLGEVAVLQPPLDDGTQPAHAESRCVHGWWGV